MERIEIERIDIKGSIVEYTFSFSKRLEKYFVSKSIFIDFGVDVSLVPLSMLSIPFVSCMSGLSWIADAVIFVDELDETFYRSYRNIKAAYQELHYDYPFRGMLVPSILRENRIKRNDRSILLFGGGIDCQTSFLRHRETIPYICNVYGWLEEETDESDVDISDRMKTEEFARRMGTESLHVRSNIFKVFDHQVIDRDFEQRLRTNYWYGFLHSMTFISIAMQPCFVTGISNVMVASSFTKGRANSVCASLMTTDSEFLFAGEGRTIHDAFEMSRQDKVGYLVRYQKKSGQRYPLQVCSFNDHNCGECDKCFRTMVEIAAEGGDPRNFGFSYDGSLTSHLKSVMERRLFNWGIWKENYYYQLARKRIEGSPDNCHDKEFVDWFLSYDFVEERKKAKSAYYRKNFWKILRRKLRNNK